MAPIFTGGIVRAEARRKREIIRKAKLQKKKLKVWFSLQSNPKTTENFMASFNFIYWLIAEHDFKS